MPEETLRILELRAENVMGLRVASVLANGEHVVLAGPNGSGKSSVLNSILFAVGGAKTFPSKPVRDGAKTASVTVNLGRFIVTRRWSESGKPYLDVKSKEGVSYNSPQKLLDGFLGEVGLDVMDLLNDDKPHITVAKALGLSEQLDELAGRRKKVGEERRVAKRALDEKQKYMGGLPRPEGEGPIAEVDVTLLAQKLVSMNKDNDIWKAHETSYLEIDRQARANLNGITATADAHKKMIAELEMKIGIVREELEAARKDYATIAEHCKAAIGHAKAKLDALPPVQSTEGIQNQIATAELTNNRARQQAAFIEAGYAVQTTGEVVQQFENEVGAIDAEKKQLLSSANLPVKGLTIEDDGLHLEGIPFDQLSMGEKIRVVVGIAVLVNPTIRVLLVRDAAVLDETNMRTVTELATEHGFQVWVEKVALDSDVTVRLMDGETVPVHPPEMRNV